MQNCSNQEAATSAKGKGTESSTTIDGTSDVNLRKRLENLLGKKNPLLFHLRVLFPLRVSTFKLTSTLILVCHVCLKKILLSLVVGDWNIQDKASTYI